MYVIMDMEWIENRNKVPYPTQIAALRVDQRWNRQECFSSLIKPYDYTCHYWDHISYNGAEKESFLSAPSAFEVLYGLFKWLRDDDILLWWGNEPFNVFANTVKHIMNYEIRQPVRMIYPTASSLCKMSGSAYKMAQKRNLQIPKIQHVSTNDVETIRILMGSILFSPAGIPSRQWKTEKTPNIPMEYFYDYENKILHKAGSSCLEGLKSIQGYSTLKACIKKGFRICPECCAKEYRTKSAEISAEVIANTDYNFVYRPKSDVFHRTNCVHARRIPYWDIKGAVYIDTCRELGKRPCRLCKPTEHFKKIDFASKKASSISRAGITRKLSTIEKRALDRHLQATNEREAQVSDKKDPDFMTRTSSAYVFWASRGYRTFHLHGCPKLAGLTELKGYARYDYAVGKGLTPCKHCKPSRKHDLIISVPTGGKIREDETSAILDSLCEAYGYPHKKCDYLYYISTPVGKWRLHIEKRPVELWHINLVKVRGSADEYHKQPRLLLSLTDTFHYIHDHDKGLMKQLRPLQNCSV